MTTKNINNSANISEQDIINLLSWDQDIRLRDVVIEIDDKTVNLNGVAEDQQSKKLAEKNALMATGVHHVKNKLKVQHEGEAALSDNEIKMKIEKMLLLEHQVNPTDIIVECKNGVVTLLGTVTSEREMYRIKGIVEHINGVSEVLNFLEIVTK